MYIIMPIVVGCLIIGLVIFLFAAKSRWQRKIKKQPVRRCTGTVKEKYMTIVPIYKSSMSVPHFTFETKRSQRLAIELDNEQYAQISEGDKGILSYRLYKKKIYFVDFKRQT